MPKEVKRWKADDGTEFDTKAEAEAHEARLSYKALQGLDAAKIRKIALYEDEEGAKQLMALYNEMNKARYLKGAVKRKKKNDPADPAAPPAFPAPLPNDIPPGDPSPAISTDPATGPTTQFPIDPDSPNAMK